MSRRKSIGDDFYKKQASENSPSYRAVRAKSQGEVARRKHRKKAREEKIPLIVKLGGSETKGLSHEQFILALEKKGISRYSAKFDQTKKALAKLPDPVRASEVDFLITQDVFVSRAIDGELVIKDFGKFINALEDTYESVEDCKQGAVANYIPQLAAVNPDYFGLSVCSIDAQQWKKGDCDVYFCLQGIAMLVTYLLALEEQGESVVHSHVGCEPSGAAFNERILNNQNLPHNPFINSGAIMCCSMIHPKDSMADRFDFVMEVWSRITGGARATFSNATYLSERETADRNFSLAYMMNEANAFPAGTNLVDTLQFYFMICSIEVTADMLAVVAGTLASGGVCPVSGERIFAEKNVKNCLSLVASCGMYDESGEFNFDIGFPAKSGVAGGLLLVIPGIAGLCTYSPRLDSHGSSFQGVAFCRELMSHISHYNISFHINLTADENYEKTLANIETELLFAVSRGDLPRVRVCISCDPSTVNCLDYDKRSPLHVAASFGHAEICKYLLAHGAKLDAKDFLNNTPADDAKRLKHKQAYKVLTGKHLFPHTYGASENVSGADTQCIFAALDDNAAGGVDKQVLISVLTKAGFSKSSYWDSMYAAIDAEKDPLDVRSFTDLVQRYSVIRNCITGHITIAEWESFTEILQNAFKEAEKNKKGSLPDFPPSLSTVNENNWEMSFCSTTAQLYNCNKSDKFWSVQSMTHIVNYLIVQELLGENQVHSYVGKEPNIRNSEFSLNSLNKPHNPIINAGALVIISMIHPDSSIAERFDFIRAQWTKLGLGNRECVRFDKQLFDSEMNTITRKWTLAFMLLERGVFPPHIKSHQHLKDTVELYLMTLSLLASTEVMAVIGAVLAHDGVCPFSGKRIFQSKYVRNALSLMGSCGLAESSGEFLFNVGIPALSGAGGGILAVIPNLGAFCTWSPRLVKNISDRGIDFFVEITKKFNFHAYDTLNRMKMDPTVFGGSWNDERICNLLAAAGKNDLIEVKKELSFIDINSRDYDNRTALHVATEKGHKNIVQYLVSQHADIHLKDRWDHTPSDCTTSAKLKMIIDGELVVEKQKSKNFLSRRRRRKKSGKCV